MREAKSIMSKTSNMVYKLLVVAVIILLISISVSPVVGNSSDYHYGISLITIKVVGKTVGDNWYGSDNSFTFTNESDEISEIYYGIDGNWFPYTGTFNVSDSGEHNLEWYAVDYFGNKSEVDGPFSFKVDKTPPDVSLEYEVVGGNLLQGWDYLFTAIATDSMSGMDSVEFYHNNVLQATVYGPGPEYTWQIKYWAVPRATFKATAYDKVENSASDEIMNPCRIIGLESSMFSTDINKKRIINSYSGNVFPSEIVEIENHSDAEKSRSDNVWEEVFDPAYVIVVFNREFGENGWVVSNVSIPILYEIDRVDEVYYQLNNGGWMLYTAPLDIPEDGIYIFSWYVVDSMGFNSIPETLSFRVDLTSPDINLISKRLAINKVKFIAEVYDTTSGIDRVRFLSDPYYGGVNDYDFPYEWIWTGFFPDKVTATVYDNAGNSNSQSMTTSRGCGYILQPFNSLLLRLLERIPLLEVLLRIMSLLR